MTCDYKDTDVRLLTGYILYLEHLHCQVLVVGLHSVDSRWVVFSGVCLCTAQVRAIGVSNFLIRHLEDLIEDGIEIVPMVNQVWGLKDFSMFCKLPFAFFLSLSVS